MTLVTVAFILACLLLVAMIVVCVRIGPRRGLWNQPAAEYRQPGRRLGIVIAGLGLIQLLALIGSAIAFDASAGMNVGIVLVGVATMLVYVLMGASSVAAERISRRKARQAAH